MDFDINSFTSRLIELMYDNFPFENQLIHGKKHRGLPHFRDSAFKSNPIITLPDGSICFELGNEQSERLVPQYHILEDAQVITKKGKATARTKGSQALISDKGKRDYGIATFSLSKDKKSTNPYYEYRKNVRGKRSLASKSQISQYASNGKVQYVNRNSKYYQNIHYHYLERILDTTTPWIADEFGLKLKRTKIENDEYIDALALLDGSYSDDIDF